MKRKSLLFALGAAAVLAAGPRSAPHGSALAIGTIRGGQIAIGRGGRIHVAWDGSSVVRSKGPLNPEAGQRGSPMLYSRLN
jgi:hypothetical protein